MQPDWNHKRIYRVYTAMQLNLRRKVKQRLPKRERVPLYVPKQSDIIWSADFMADALACGRRFRTFNVDDDFNREAMHIEHASGKLCCGTIIASEISRTISTQSNNTLLLVIYSL